ncbi:MAG: M13 family metallopeptidase [Candidatus Melainabacteria bacterium]|nr:M13 family metallopeptidase [Candidatus Melainabacteria bacterium]
MNESPGIKTSYMDLSADPGVDFNRFVNGAWNDSAVIPPEYPRWGAFLMLRERALENVHVLLKELASAEGLEPGSNEQKVGDLFATALDEETIEARGATPILGEIARVNTARSRNSLADVIAHLHLNQVGVLFGFGAFADLENSSQNMAHASQAGLGLPDRDYYLKDDEKSVALRAKYLAHITRMFELLGEKPSMARKHARAVMRIETALAKASMGKVELRDPANITNRMTVDDFVAMVPNLAMRRYFQKLETPAFEDINVMQPKFFAALNELIASEPLRDIKAYMRWHVVHGAASLLSSDFVNENFQFYSKELTGTKELEPRWKRAVSLTSGALGEAIGQVYVARYFPPEAKARMLELVANIQEALRETLEEVDWMSDETRANALDKLAAFEAMIGYPDKWKDYSNLEIDRESLVGNMFRAARFGARRNLARIGQPVDRTEWGMTPQTVNAYYSPLRNQIVFPAAILQPPFFDFEADDAANYGGIGVVIGHEITHGFDDKGSKFDARGNLKMWWTDADRANFEGRMNLIRTQFGNFTVAGGARVQGDLVCGEAAADLGGVKLAYRALQKALAKSGRQTDSNGYTDEQRFFIAFGQIWASKTTPEYEQFQVTNDPHPPARYRVNGTLAHVSEFVEAFGLAPDCPMMLPEAERCKLW